VRPPREKSLRPQIPSALEPIHINSICFAIRGSHSSPPTSCVLVQIAENHHLDTRVFRQTFIRYEDFLHCTNCSQLKEVQFETSNQIVVRNSRRRLKQVVMRNDWKSVVLMEVSERRPVQSFANVLRNPGSYRFHWWDVEKVDISDFLRTRRLRRFRRSRRSDILRTDTIRRCGGHILMRDYKSRILLREIR
jgi:hypothetical protein